MSPSTASPSVLVVGAGPSGLIMALTLAQNGVSVRVIEKDNKFHIGQRGPGMQPRSMEVACFLGLWPDVKNGSIPVPTTRVYEMPEGVKTKLDFDMAPIHEPLPDIPFPNPRMIGQDHFEEIVRAHLAKYNVSVELSKELINFEQNDDGVVANVRVRDEHGEHDEEIRTEYLISAEGARSVARKQLGLSFLGETRDSFRCVLVDVTIKGLSPDRWHNWGDFGDKCVWVRPTEYPDVWSLVIGGINIDTEKISASREALLEHIYNLTKRTDLEFGEFIWKTEWRLNVRMVDRLNVGRVFLVGDAGHLHSPTGGQGANTAVQESFNLGWKLALVCKGLANPKLLDSYHNERHPVVKDMLTRTTNLFEAQLAHKNVDTKSKPPVHTDLFRQLGVNYRWSDIVVDDQPGASSDKDGAAYLPEDKTILRAGDRAPEAQELVPENDASVKPTSLFALYKPTYHTVLLFDPTPDQMKAVTSSLSHLPKDLFHIVVILSPTTTLDTIDGVNAILVDTAGHARTAYPPATQGYPIIVVRPDGVIGAVVRDATGVDRYVKGIF